LKNVIKKQETRDMTQVVGQTFESNYTTKKTPKPKKTTKEKAARHDDTGL
jgi:hypothetical protein